MELTEKEKTLIREALTGLLADLQNEKEHCEYVIRHETLKKQMLALVTDRLATCESIIEKLGDTVE